MVSNTNCGFVDSANHWCNSSGSGNQWHYRTSCTNSNGNFYWITYLCLVLLQVPKCFVLVQIFCARTKIYLQIVVVTKILCQTKRWFAFSKIGFCAGTKGFEEALNAVKFLGWLKIFGPAQNILGPVKGQGIRLPLSLNYIFQMDSITVCNY